ncbi:unnamed protein product [Dicrocoelium dendriticum]|nr:unnamed protein product [Dicrocoelium dendriticum]
MVVSPRRFPMNERYLVALMNPSFSHPFICVRCSILRVVIDVYPHPTHVHTLLDSPVKVACRTLWFSYHRHCRLTLFHGPSNANKSSRVTKAQFKTAKNLLSTRASTHSFWTTGLTCQSLHHSDANLDFLVQSKRTQLRNLDQSGDNTLLETRSGRLIYGPVRASYGKPPVSPPSCLSPVKHLDESDRLTDTLIQPSDSDTGDEPDDRGNHPPRNRVSVKPPGTGGQKQGDDSSVTAANFERAELEKLYAAHRDWHRRLRVAVAAGDCVHLRNLLPSASSIPHGSDESAAGRIVSDSPSAANPTSPSTHSPNGDLPPNPEVCTRLLNHPLAEGRTLLHIAVELQSDPNVIYTLLDSGCDPTLRDTSGFTPYKLAAGLRKKALTMVFRRFRFIHPDRYDYEKAEIPAPLDPNKEAEKLERDRERQRRQRQRLKERKAAERALQDKLREEEAERQRFLALSDREKHALVAERRLLANKAAAGELPQVFVRCFQCACDISGKVPFTYMDYRFCSPGCLKTHRLSSTSCKPNA